MEGRLADMGACVRVDECAAAALGMREQQVDEHLRPCEAKRSVPIGLDWIGEGLPIRIAIFRLGWVGLGWIEEGCRLNLMGWDWIVRGADWTGLEGC